MKKDFILSMVIAYTMLTACFNDEIVDVNTGGTISFRTLIGIATCTSQETTASLFTFKVTAIKGAGTEFATTVTKSGSEWSIAETYYWPNYALKLYAYANGPAAGKGRVSITKDVKTITDFTPVGNAAEYKDLLVVYGTGTKDNYNSNPASLTFKHALSQIEVRAKNEKASSAKVEIIRVKLVNMVTKAILTFPESTLNNTKLSINNWSNQIDLSIPSKAYYSDGTKAVVLNSTEFQSVTSGEDNFMVIPQQITAWSTVEDDLDAETNKQDAYLAVPCRISNLSEAGETLVYPAPTADDPKIGKYAYSVVAINIKTINQWEPGKKYVYSLTFCPDGGGAGKVDPDPENPGGNPNTDEIPGTDGEDTLGGPTKFSITVEDWEIAEVLADMQKQPEF